MQTGNCPRGQLGHMTQEPEAPKGPAEDSGSEARGSHVAGRGSRSRHTRASVHRAFSLLQLDRTFGEYSLICGVFLTQTFNVFGKQANEKLRKFYALQTKY